MNGQVYIAAHGAAPSTAEKAAFDDIVSAFNEGRNLKNYMGTHLMATSPNKGDLLAKHTGIHHLHLEQRGKNNKFPGLTDKLLFYIEHKNTAYFITIKHHPKGSKWFDRSLLEIAYNNWEGLFQYFPMNSNVKNLSDDDIFKIMKSHINILLPYHDGFILSPGLGENICGRSVEACLQVTRYLQMLSEWKNNLIAMESNLRMKTIEATGVQLPSPIEYTLSMKDGFFTAVDTSRTLEVLLFKASDVGPEFTHLQAPENQ